MNISQIKLHRIILTIGLIIFLAICLFVPWQYTFQYPDISKVYNPAGYHWIFNPPPPAEALNSGRKVLHGVQVDFYRWLIELAAVVFTVGITWHLTKTKE
jgi:branched-subunit amino acid ABC-type transport system permease component